MDFSQTFWQGNLDFILKKYRPLSLWLKENEREVSGDKESNSGGNSMKDPDSSGGQSYSYKVTPLRN